MEMKTLWMVSELFYPEETATAYLLTNIANKLALKYRIHVLAGHEVYSMKVPHNGDIAENIDIRRVGGARIDKNNVIARLFRAFSLSRKFAQILKKEAKTGDAVIAVTNPAFNIISASKICQKKKLKLIILCHDIFPENAIPAKLISPKNLLYRIIKTAFNKAYRRADLVVTCGSDMSAILEDKIGYCSRPRILTVTNWSNPDILPIGDTKTNDRLIVKFAGNLGRVQGLDTIVDIIGRLHSTDVQFVFQGDGAFSKAIAEAGCPNITVKGPYKREDEQAVLSECDIGLVSLSEGMYGLGVPSKSYNLMAAGKPILYIGPANTEIFNMVKKFDIGWAFDISKEDEIVEFLSNLRISERTIFEEKGMRARKLAETQYSRETILNRYYALI